MEHMIYSAEALGFLTASLVFLIALFCIARGWGNILTTFILLLFSLFAGFTVANQELIRGYLSGSIQAPQGISLEEFRQLQKEVQELKYPHAE